MARITVIATPNLRSSAVKAVDYLKDTECDSLFLPISRDLEAYLTELSEGLPYEYVLDG